jgi:hypothetical protein
MFNNMPAALCDDSDSRHTLNIIVHFLFMKRDQRRLPLLAFYIRYNLASRGREPTREGKRSSEMGRLWLTTRYTALMTAYRHFELTACFFSVYHPVTFVAGKKEEGDLARLLG